MALYTCRLDIWSSAKILSSFFFRMHSLLSCDCFFFLRCIMQIDVFFSFKFLLSAIKRLCYWRRFRCLSHTLMLTLQTNIYLILFCTIFKPAQQIFLIILWNDALFFLCCNIYAIVWLCREWNYLAFYL